MKLRNGSIDTPTMIRLLMRHARDEVPWSAEAGQTQLLNRMVAEATASGNVIIQWRNSESFGHCQMIHNRSDWTIIRPKRETGTRPRLKIYGPTTQRADVRVYTGAKVHAREIDAGWTIYAERTKP